MKKYAKVINDETKLCIIGTGDNIEYYISQGMEEKEVEQAYNGCWYLLGYAPTEPEEDIKKREIWRLKDELASTDYKIIKCSEYNLNKQDLPYDIAELHAHRQALRDRINELENIEFLSEAE